MLSTSQIKTFFSSDTKKWEKKAGHLKTKMHVRVGICFPDCLPFTNENFA
jgi:hypothetical protein